MGTKMAPAYALFNMQIIERDLLTGRGNKLLTWFRYVYCIFAFSTNDGDKLTTYLFQHRNGKTALYGACGLFVRQRYYKRKTNIQIARAFTSLADPLIVRESHTTRPVYFIVPLHPV